MPTWLKIISCAVAFVLFWAIFLADRSETAHSYIIAKGATLLYYTAPAAIASGDTIFVGYVTSAGAVTVVEMSRKSGQLIRSTVVHEAGAADDHSAPAIWNDGERLLIATSRSSQDLFVYALESGAVTQLCRYQGHFTYPQFHDGGKLIVRQEDGPTGSIYEIADVQRCSQPSLLYAAPTGQWLYFQPSRDLIWSSFDTKELRHKGVWRNGLPVNLPATSLKETLVWSASHDFLAVTRFSDSFACCSSGQMIAELYQNGKAIYASQPQPTPSYPTGIVVREGGGEAIFPDKKQIVRRSLPDLNIRPGCSAEGRYNIHPHYVVGGGGAYVWTTFGSSYAKGAYDDADVRLCLIQ